MKEIYKIILNSDETFYDEYDFLPFFRNIMNMSTYQAMYKIIDCQDFRFKKCEMYVHCDMYNNHPKYYLSDFLKHGYVEKVKLLLLFGTSKYPDKSKIDIKNYHIIDACRGGYRMVKLLLLLGCSQGKIYERDQKIDLYDHSRYYDIFESAVESNNYKVVKLLLSIGTPKGLCYERKYKINTHGTYVCDYINHPEYDQYRYSCRFEKYFDYAEGPFKMACENGYYKIVKALLYRPVNFNQELYEILCKRNEIFDRHPEDDFKYAYTYGDLHIIDNVIRPWCDGGWNSDRVDDRLLYDYKIEITCIRDGLKLAMSGGHTQVVQLLQEYLSTFQNI